MRIKKRAGQQRARIDCCGNTHGIPACLVEMKYGRLPTWVLTLTSYKGRGEHASTSPLPSASIMYFQGSFDDSVVPKRVLYWLTAQFIAMR